MTIAGFAQVHKSLPAWRPLARAGVVMSIAATAVLLTACGGGDQVKQFRPSKIVSFGDEGSALVTDTVNLSGGGTTTLRGLKYGVNAMSGYMNVTPDLISGQQDRTSTTGGGTILANSSQTAWALYPLVSNYSSKGVTAIESLYGSEVVVVQYKDLVTQVDNSGVTGPEPVDINFRYNYSCVDSPLWIQVVANAYHLGYQSQCPMSPYGGGMTYAASGATVDDTAAQLASHRAELDSNTLVTVMAGQNDILLAYDQIKANTLSPDAAKASMTNRGEALAAVINDAAATGARVLFVKLGDLGLSPLANADGSSATLSALTLAFNKGVLNAINNNGKKIGIVNFYDTTQYVYKAVVRDNGNYSIYGVVFNNMTSPVCNLSTVYKPDGSAVNNGSVAPLFGGDGLLYCSSQTLNSGVSITSYFWADQVHLSPGAQSVLGGLAYDRANDKTF